MSDQEKDYITERFSAEGLKLEAFPLDGVRAQVAIVQNQIQAMRRHPVLIDNREPIFAHYQRRNQP